MQVVMRARASNEASEGAKNSDATVIHPLEREDGLVYTGRLQPNDKNGLSWCAAVKRYDRIHDIRGVNDDDDDVDDDVEEVEDSLGVSSMMKHEQVNKLEHSNDEMKHIGKEGFDAGLTRAGSERRSIDMRQREALYRWVGGWLVGWAGTREWERVATTGGQV